MQVIVELQKVPGRTLGFSIAGGRGSTPAYEDVDQVRIPRRALLTLPHKYSRKPHMINITWVVIVRCAPACIKYAPKKLEWPWSLWQHQLALPPGHVWPISVCGLWTMYASICWSIFHWLIFLMYSGPLLIPLQWNQTMARYISETAGYVNHHAIMHHYYHCHCFPLYICTVVANNHRISASSGFEWSKLWHLCVITLLPTNKCCALLYGLGIK